MGDDDGESISPPPRVEAVEEEDGHSANEFGHKARIRPP